MGDETGSGLGQWLRDKCQQEQMSLRETGERTGLSHATIQVIMKGGRPSAETVRKLAHAFSKDGSNHRLALEDELLTRAGYRSPSANMLSEPVAELVDIITDFNEPQLKVLREFAIYLIKLSAVEKNE